MVARGYNQTYGIHYDETFGLVAKMSIVRILTSCAANFGWSLHQLDVKNVFFYMVSFKRKYIWRFHLVFLALRQSKRFVDCRNLYMVSNSLHEHGLIDLDVHCVVWGTNSELGITLFSTDTLDDRL